MTIEMSLNGYDFPWAPDRWTIPKADKFTGRTLTWSSAGFFSFGSSIIGKEIVLEWDWMSREQFDALDAIVQADTQVAWVTGYYGDAFNVEILGLDGEYFEVTAYEFPWRRNVKLTMMIMSQNYAYS
jgi:hypothetical protein